MPFWVFLILWHLLLRMPSLSLERETKLLSVPLWTLQYLLPAQFFGLPRNIIKLA